LFNVGSRHKSNAAKFPGTACRSNAAAVQNITQSGNLSTATAELNQHFVLFPLGISFERLNKRIF